MDVCHYRRVKLADLTCGLRSWDRLRILHDPDRGREEGILKVQKVKVRVNCCLDVDGAIDSKIRL